MALQRGFLCLLALAVLSLGFTAVFWLCFPSVLLSALSTRQDDPGTNYAFVRRHMTPIEAPKWLRVVSRTERTKSQANVDYEILPVSPSTSEYGNKAADILANSTDQVYRCIGNIAEEEVEDIMCLSRPPYIESAKNPCWYSDTIGTSPGNSSRLRCLPYFHLLGTAKSSTTDLYKRMTQHPDLLTNSGLFQKETLWWSWKRYGFSVRQKNASLQTFGDYVSYFDEAAVTIEQELLKNRSRQHDLIVGDASPPDFWDFRGWTQVPQNRGLYEPKVLTPRLMMHMYKNPKFILLFRNPIDRLYSDFFFLRQGQSPYDFHKAVVTSISMLKDCSRESSTLQCFTSNVLYWKLRTRIHFGCYSVFLREWLKVFPINKFLFLRMEDYSADIPGHLSRIFEFLNMAPLSADRLETIAALNRSRATLAKQTAGPMFPKTRLILNKFYRPYNMELSAMLQDRRFLWL